MRRYKITQRGNNRFYVYMRVFLFFWKYEETFMCLENAQTYIKFWETPEIEVK